jgi:nucleosome binding factor SPN SPT16 subunit
MKTVNDDTYGFYEEGGWSFLTGTGSVSKCFDSHAGLIIQDDGSSESSEGSEFGGAVSDAASSVASSEDSDSASDCKLLPSRSQSS